MLDRNRPSSLQLIVIENARLRARVRQLERELKRERSRNKGLQQGVTSLNESVVSLRERGDGAASAPRHDAVA